MMVTMTAGTTVMNSVVSGDLGGRQVVVDGLAMGGEHSSDSSTGPTLNCPGIYVSGVAGGRQGEAARG